MIFYFCLHGSPKLTPIAAFSSAYDNNDSEKIRLPEIYIYKHILFVALSSSALLLSLITTNETSEAKRTLYRWLSPETKT